MRPHLCSHGWPLDGSGERIDLSQTVSIDADVIEFSATSSTLVSELNPNTKVILFAANLQLNQGETASAVVVNLVDANNQSFDVPAEDVRAVPGFAFTQVKLRLPDNLAAGACMVTIKAHGQISNTGTMRIVLP